MGTVSPCLPLTLPCRSSRFVFLYSVSPCVLPCVPFCVSSRASRSCVSALRAVLVSRACRLSSRSCVLPWRLVLRLDVSSRPASRFHCLLWEATFMRHRFALLAARLVSFSICRFRLAFRRACRLSCRPVSSLRLVLGVSFHRFVSCVPPCVPPCVPSSSACPSDAWGAPFRLAHRSQYNATPYRAMPYRATPCRRTRRRNGMKDETRNETGKWDERMRAPF